ncbi:MAG: FHA domain-containing protein [Planctomycetaceae bacterium]|nr:FHA domain-containing protein [Planctomycetaceae bacterium]
MPGIRVKNGPSQGQTFTITEKPLIIGRDETCDLSLQDKGASRQHAEIFRIGDMSFIRDLESKNGTFVNDNRITEEMLRDGDRVQIGGTVIVFEPLAGGRADDELDFSEDELEAFYELRLEDLTAVNVGEGDVSSEIHLRALYRLSRLVASEDVEDELVKKGLTFIVETLRADGAYLFGRDPQKGGIVTLGSHVPKGGQSGQLSRTIIRKVLQDKRALLVTDAMRDDRFSSNESVMRHNIHAVICAPMPLYEGVEAALYIAGDDPGISFTEQELELVAAMADQMGLALAHIASKLRRREYMLSAVRMLLRAADVNTPGIMKRNERLAGYMRAIGRALQLGPSVLEKLQLAGMLHNYSDMVGDSSSRTPEERVAETVDLMARETFFPEIEDMIAYQLERYDGTGPKGLLGTELPLGARIFQAAHDLSAATEADDSKEALAAKVLEMTRGAGKVYDAEIVKAVSEAERAGTLAMTLEEQWRQARSSRMSAFLHDEEAAV